MRKAVSLDDKNVASHIVLAVMLQRKGDLAGALQEMNAAVVADPEECDCTLELSPTFTCARTTQLRPKRRFDKAAEDLPEDSTAADLLATLLHPHEPAGPGCVSYADLVAKYPKSAPLKLSYARILIAQEGPAQGPRPLARSWPRATAEFLRLPF